ncbi:MAG: SCP2 sterol-binding domain-containing protein [Actinomycetota bacterium]|nr:SCP2 sterol-binding domain-containing protein [Actinomycetota bacterium]MDD5667797.1 SCP2 sterol-binding domain-containing protein [Actinomycetota bacterium]
MEWRVGSEQQIDEDLKDRVLQRIEENTLGMEDMRDYFTVFVQISNHTEDIQDEVEGFDRSFQINVEGKPVCWLSVRDRAFEAGSGSLPSPDIMLNMDEEVALGIFSGSLDATAAYMCGDLDVDGIISDAIRFKDLLDLVQDEMD